MGEPATPWVVLRREDLEELLDAAVERGRKLGSGEAPKPAPRRRRRETVESLDKAREIARRKLRQKGAVDK